MTEHYYVDGYNILHADPTWSALADADLEAAREAVVEAVSAWAARTGNHACVFFDGQGRTHERIAPEPGRPNVEVVFTSSRLSADALIERGVYLAHKRETVIAVTSDRGISDFCLGLGALTMRADHFVSMLREPPHRARPSGAADAGLTLEQRIGDSSSEHLRRLRDRLESD
jgi:predicted RNA-binding protein with PIN domain